MGGGLAGSHGHSETDHQDPRRLLSQQVAALQRHRLPKLIARVRCYCVSALERVIAAGLSLGAAGLNLTAMIGAAMSRRAGLKPAATALLVALVAGTGCASPVAHHAPAHGRSPVRVAAVEPKPIAVTLPRVHGGLPWPVVLRTANGVFVIALSGAIHVDPGEIDRGTDGRQLWSVNLGASPPAA